METVTLWRPVGVQEAKEVVEEYIPPSPVEMSWEDYCDQLTKAYMDYIAKQPRPLQISVYTINKISFDIWPGGVYEIGIIDGERQFHDYKKVVAKIIRKLCPYFLLTGDKVYDDLGDILKEVDDAADYIYFVGGTKSGERGIYLSDKKVLTMARLSIG